MPMVYPRCLGVQNGLVSVNITCNEQGSSFCSWKDCRWSKVFWQQLSCVSFTAMCLVVFLYISCIFFLISTVLFTFFQRVILQYWMVCVWNYHNHRSFFQFLLVKCFEWISVTGFMPDIMTYDVLQYHLCGTSDSPAVRVFPGWAGRWPCAAYSPAKKREITSESRRQ